MQDSTTIGGFAIPSANRLFLALVAVHVAAGLIAVIAGIVAMAAPKGRGRHTRAGLIYFRALMVVGVTMSLLALGHWPGDAILFVLGLFSVTAAWIARRAAIRRPRRLRVHIAGMGASYVLLVVAFYVDNGPQLPLWRSLPPVSYWLVPVVVGVPLIMRSVMTHPLVRRSESHG
jgi:hypothetical protein